MGLLDILLGNAGEASTDDIAREFAPLLAPGETLQRAFRFVRDLVVCTDRRLVLVDKEGVTAKRVEYRSIPYRSIVQFTLVTAGPLDVDAVLHLWLMGIAQPLELHLGRSSGATDLVALLAQHARD